MMRHDWRNSMKTHGGNQLNSWSYPGFYNGGGSRGGGRARGYGVCGQNTAEAKANVKLAYNF